MPTVASLAATSARLGAGLAAAVVALGLRAAFDPWLGSTLPYTTLFGAVAFAVWIAGYPAAIVAAVAGFLGAEWIFVQPHEGVRPWVDLTPGLVAYGVSCAIIIALGESTRRAHAALREADVRLRGAALDTEATEARLRFVTDAAPMLISYVDAAGRYRQVNRAYETWFGRSRADTIGRRMRDVVGDDAWRTLAPHVEAALAGREVRYEAWVPYRDGGPRWIQATYVPDLGSDGRPRGFVALVHDVTARKVAEAEVRESEEKFRRIVETANEGIWLLDENARVTFVNRRMGDLLGYEPEDMLGRPKWEFLLGNDRERVLQLFARRRAGISEQVDLCFQHREGRPVWMIMAARPVIGEAGVFLGSLDMFTDVTERKRLEAELQERVSELADAARRKDAFIATLSHELRNPLAPLRNAVSLLHETAPDAAELGSIRGLLQRQVDQLTRLTDDLLDASRVTRGRLELRPQRVALAEVVESAIEASRPEIEAGGHGLEVSLPESPIVLDADPARLAQVLTNLLNNAAAYTPPGGLIRLAAFVAGERLTVRVSDTGIGIDAAHLGGIFELFSQVNTALDRPKGGLGIGLALVRGIVELHGGTVEARSAGAGKGSEFELTLPLPRETRATAVERGSADSRRARRPRRVLVVDDNRDAAESLALLLRLRGHEVRETYDGLDAVDAAATFRPDAVLLDIGLPGLNGYEVARRIRQEPWSRDVLLVAVTGWGQDADKRRSADAGIDHHMTKPVDLARLSDLLDAEPPAGSSRVLARPSLAP